MPLNPWVTTIFFTDITLVMKHVTPTIIVHPKKITKYSYGINENYFLIEY